MDPEQQRIEEDLRGLLRGDVRCDDVFTQLYASDASIYEMRPAAVVRPRSLADVVATVKYAAENSLSIHARGAGSGLAGESLGRGIVLDFSRYFRRIVADDGDRIRVQPGVVHEWLNRFLARSGRLFGPDPAMRNVTTVGSVVAVDSGGSHWPRYGSARQHVEEMQIVLADGTVHRVGRHDINSPIVTNGDEINGETLRLAALVQSVASLIQRNKPAIEHCRPQSAVNRSGYRLYDVIDGGQLDLAKLLVGSEGTLALITEVTLTVDPLPAHRGCALLLFESLDRAAHAVLEIAQTGPTACDLMDRRHLSLARESDVRYELLIPGETEAMLLVEYHAASRDELRAKLDGIVEQIQFESGFAAASYVAEDEADFQLYWGLAQRFGLVAAHAVCGGYRGARGRHADFLAASAGHHETPASNGVGVWSRGARSAARSSVSGSLESRRGADNGATCVGVVRAGLASRRDDQWRACRWFKPHAISREAVRAASECFSRAETNLRSARLVKPRQDCAGGPCADHAKPAANRSSKTSSQRGHCFRRDGGQ
jgi:FAD/FMN-containing dehydrogenase